MSDTTETSLTNSTTTNTEPAKSAALSNGSSNSPKLTGTALWVAILAIVAWLGFSAFLVARAGTSDIEWTRVAWVFGSIQAVAFAAAGAVFGTTVQQQNVNGAQQQAASAKKDADQQREAAIKGRALATAIQADAVTYSTNGAGDAKRMGIADAANAEPGDELRQRHAQLSKAMFGDLI